MLVQTTNAIALRFQNVARHGRDPLAEFELDPLRPLSGFMWGYVHDEPSRLSAARRAYEYSHESASAWRAGRPPACGRPTHDRSSSRRSTICCGSPISSTAKPRTTP